MAAVLVVLVTIAFLGLSWFTTRTMLAPASVSEEPEEAVPEDSEEEAAEGVREPAPELVRAPMLVAAGARPTAVTRAVGTPTVASEALPARAASQAPEEKAVTVARGEVSGWIVASMVVGMGALVLLGVHLPGDLRELLNHAARQLEVAR